MATILVTGFTPFAGRAVNASWLAAHWLAEHHNTRHTVHAALLPVIWGAPGDILRSWHSTCRPDLIISLGEGHPGRFAIETRARNLRSSRQDNTGQMPPASQVSAQGCEQYRTTLDAEALCADLSARGYPAQTSDDAGAFLCEETLYCLEALREETATGLQVVFCHLPPFGTELQVADQPVTCNQSLLSAFVSDLLTALTTR